MDKLVKKKTPVWKIWTTPSSDNYGKLVVTKKPA